MTNLNVPPMNEVRATMIAALHDFCSCSIYDREEYNARLQTYLEAWEEYERLFAQAVCPHLHTVDETTGGMHFAGGEVIDDIVEKAHCLDCGKDF